jgi:hypothetical protein
VKSIKFGIQGVGEIVMRNCKAVLAILSLCGLAGCGGGSSGSAPNSAPATGISPPGGPVTSSVAGRVVAKTGAPLAGVTITAYKTNDHTDVVTTTDANGNYSFSGLQTGSLVQYEIRPEKSGYGFYPSLASGGASILKDDYNALYRTVISYFSLAGTSVTGANFDGYDGSISLVSLPSTGQTISYASGDDGAVRKGIPWPGTRFTDNQNGTISDRLTGLIWLKNAGCFNARNWTDALGAANQLATGACGLSDGSTAGQWRMPNVIELESLVDVERSNPALPAGHAFSNVANTYWSSTTYRGLTTQSWVIDFRDGRYINDTINNTKTSAAHGVWAVKSGASGAIKLPATGQFIVYASGDDASAHSGVPLTSPRFVDGGNGTVTDTVTGLIWLKKADCIRQPWAGAVGAVNALASGQCGLTDGSTAGSWRVPNRSEMLSLVDRAETNQALRFNTVFLKADKSVDQPAIFTNFVETEFYWTSSTDFADTSQAWTLYSCDYGVYNISKANIGYTLAVR